MHKVIDKWIHYEPKLPSFKSLSLKLKKLNQFLFHLNSNVNIITCSKIITLRNNTILTFFNKNSYINFNIYNRTIYIRQKKW